MKVEANISFLHQGGQVTAFFESVEQARNVLDDFSEQLAKVREYENREDVVFSFTASGAEYCLDLRKCASAVMEIMDEWGPVVIAANLERAKQIQAMKTIAREAGCEEEMEKFINNKRG